MGLKRLTQNLLYPAPRSRVEGEDLVLDDGPDDLWPEETMTIEPETAEITQWGLRLPDGTVAWGRWQNIPFDTPLDRMRMIAALSRTALDVGFGEGDQTAAFLAHYSWATRQATVSTIFSDITGTYALGDPAVAEVSTNGSTASEENNVGE